jgi:uncharacterized membrane protein
MATANYLAELWGFSLIIIPLAMLINPKKIKYFFELAEKESSFLLCGVVSLVLGIASVLAFNVWSYNWTVVLTILGWLAIIKGIAILFLPEFTSNWYGNLRNTSDKWISITWVVAVLIGCILVYLGLTA